MNAFNMKKFIILPVLAATMAGIMVHQVMATDGGNQTVQAALYKNPYFTNISWTNPQIQPGEKFTTAIKLKSKTRKTQILLDGKIIKTCKKTSTCQATVGPFDQEDEHEFQYILTDAKGATTTQSGVFVVDVEAQKISGLQFTANALQVPVGKSLSLLAQLKGKKYVYDMGLATGAPGFEDTEDAYRISARHTNSNGNLIGPFTTEEVGERRYTLLVVDPAGTEYRTVGSFEVVE